MTTELCEWCRQRPAIENDTDGICRGCAENFERYCDGIDSAVVMAERSPEVIAKEKAWWNKINAMLKKQRQGLLQIDFTKILKSNSIGSSRLSNLKFQLVFTD